MEAIRDGSLDPEAKFRAALLAHVRANIEVDAAAMSRILLTEWRHLTGREFEEVLGQRRAYEQLWDDIIVEAIGPASSARTWTRTWCASSLCRSETGRHVVQPQG